MLERIAEARAVIDELEKEANELHGQVTSIESGRDLWRLADDGTDQELTLLKSENAKLKHRYAILQRALEKEKLLYEGKQSANSVNTDMISIITHLTELFSTAIEKALPSLPHTEAIISICKSGSKFGDYQCNSALSLVRLVQEKGAKVSPRSLAEEIIKNLDVSPLVERVELAGPGYINIFLAKSYAINVLTSLLQEGVKPPKIRRQRVVIDFSSPNIAKEMHVGHLRSTIIGESISRFLEFLGHDVLRVNHLGDWGTQFGMLIAHLEDRFPDYLQKSPPISDLQAFYKESKTRFDDEEAFKKRAYDRVVQLQGGEENATKAWLLICDVSRQEFQKIYDRLDVSITEKGESFYQSRMVDVVKYLKEKNMLIFDEGRQIMWPTGTETGIPLTVVKSDGGFTYDTSDLAALRYRVEEEKADWIIYVVDAGQSVHLKNIFAAGIRCGILDPRIHRTDHVQFGVVLGEDGKKFKTRSGDTVKLSELLDEGIKRAIQKLEEKGRDQVLTPDELKAARESISYSCIKYADLSHNRQNEYVFSFDKMLDDRGNTAVYLLYTYVRICSIARNSGEDFSDKEKVLKTHTLILDHENEWKLAKTLLRFPDVSLKICDDLMLHSLCEFCYDICTVFSEFYDNCYCIVKDKNGRIQNVNHSRILLCEATAALLKQCFYILGLKPISKI